MDGHTVAHLFVCVLFLQIFGVWHVVHACIHALFVCFCYKGKKKICFLLLKTKTTMDNVAGTLHASVCVCFDVYKNLGLGSWLVGRGRQNYGQNFARTLCTPCVQFCGLVLSKNNSGFVGCSVGVKKKRYVYVHTKVWAMSRERRKHKILCV